jgi:hypothetical protein
VLIAHSCWTAKIILGHCNICKATDMLNVDLSVFVHRQLCGAAAVFPDYGKDQEIFKSGETRLHLRRFS